MNTIILSILFLLPFISNAQNNNLQWDSLKVTKCYKIRYEISDSSSNEVSMFALSCNDSIIIKGDTAKILKFVAQYNFNQTEEYRDVLRKLNAARRILQYTEANNGRVDKKDLKKIRDAVREYQDLMNYNPPKANPTP